MNPQNGWDSAPDAENGIHWWKNRWQNGRQKKATGRKNHVEPVQLSRIQTETEERLHTNIGELDRVLGGGIVQGSMTLVGGDPGIGKSTLLLPGMQEDCRTGKESIVYLG